MTSSLEKYVFSMKARVCIKLCFPKSCISFNFYCMNVQIINIFAAFFFFPYNYCTSWLHRVNDVMWPLCMSHLSTVLSLSSISIPFTACRKNSMLVQAYACYGLW